MKTYLRMICLALCVALPMVSQARDPSSNGSSPRERIIKALPGKSIIKGDLTRGVTLEERIRNDRASYCVRVSVCLLDDQGKYLQDRPNRMFTEGECMGIQIVSEKPGFAYLFYVQADGSEKCLLPNKFHQNNRIAAKRTIMVPGRSYDFNLRIGPPFGQETLIALVTEKPLADAAFGNKSLTEGPVMDVDLDRMIAKGVEIELRDNPDKWAEHGIKITTHAKGVSFSVDTSPQKQRVGLCCGITDYLDERIPDLSICHVDAITMADTLKKYCNLDAIGVLINSEATRAAVERAFMELIEITKPGDDIFIYWSGHGASCANTGDEDNEPDGLDEFLVPYDASPDNLEATVVMDDTLGRWIQALDGRNVVVILDACHSGGQATDKGIGNGSGTKELTGENGGRLKTVRWGHLPSPGDFLQGEFARIKDIGQDDAVMLASSASAEISAERRDQKLSVMTYFLVEKITKADSLTLQQAYEYVSREVPKYMKEYYPGRTQTPVLWPEGADVTLK